MVGHENMGNERCQSHFPRPADKKLTALGWRVTLKAPFANAHINVSTTQKEQPRENFPPPRFLHILSAHGAAAMSRAGSTQRGTKAGGWDGLKSSNHTSVQQMDLPHVPTCGDTGLCDAGLHRPTSPFCRATPQPRGFSSAHRRSETSVRMVIRLPGCVLLFWELDCGKNPLSRWDTHDYRWKSMWERIQWQSEMKFNGKGKKTQSPCDSWDGQGVLLAGKKTGDLRTHAWGQLGFWVMRDHEDSGLWILFSGTACSSQKCCCFLGSSENQYVYVLCQKGRQPSCEEENGQHYVLMTSPCVWESRAHLASKGFLSWMLSKLVWSLLMQRIVSTIKS